MIASINTLKVKLYQDQDEYSFTIWPPSDSVYEIRYAPESNFNKCAMRYIHLSIILIIFNINSSIAQNTYTVSHIELKNALLVKAIGEYIKEWSDVLQNHGVVDVTCDVANGNYYIGYMLSKAEVVSRPPTFFSKIQGKIVLIYTGFEMQLTYEAKSFDELFKQSGETLEDKLDNSFYEPVIWKISVSANSYSREVVSDIPLLYK